MASSMPVAGGALGSAATATGETTRGETKASGTLCSTTGCEVTITLLTNLPVRGSGRITVVMRRDTAISVSTGPAAHNATEASLAAHARLKHNLIKMFCSLVYTKNQSFSRGCSQSAISSTETRNPMLSFPCEPRGICPGRGPQFPDGVRQGPAAVSGRPAGGMGSAGGGAGRRQQIGRAHV